MGVYPTKCPSCNEDFLWFSGSQHQLCSKCLIGNDNKEEKKEMNTEQQVIDALKEALKAKTELIEHLKGEVERLKASQVINPIVVNPAPVIGPVQPWVPSTPIPGYPGIGQPWYQQPLSPLIPPFVVTSVGTSPSTDSAIVGKDPLPAGSIQISTQGPTGMGHTGLCQPGCMCDNNKANVSIDSVDLSSISVLNGVPSSCATSVSNNATLLFNNIKLAHKVS